ncbi:phage portal protein [Marinobacter oulmenensis]|uniref:HK97 family phage portal protein n=1 Tax=Marinobacter oulmenensis TaxID=643747 RepID=A0A840UNX2_9GAMM|nr:phage portal protein [Marinobacter oulmenensis]MBB5322328.1 HK97 family phage portal protein [Marinobacter oulmenensis]
MDLVRLEAELENTRRDLANVRNETQSWGSGYEALQDLFAAHANVAGVHVDDNTAMRVSAVYACVRVIAGAIGSLPFQVYRSTENHRERFNQHPLYRVIHTEPNPQLSAVVFWETVVMHILLAGNHFSLIARNRGGQPLGLTPLKPSRVEVDERGGRLIYFVYFDDGNWAAFDQDDILHVPGVGWDGRRGLSVIRSVGQNSIGTALAADEYSGKFFANDSTPRGYIRFPDGKKLTDDQAQVIRDYWFEKHQGISNKHLPAFIPDGGEFKEIEMSAEDSQLIETRKFQVKDIARIFGVPPHMIGDTEASSSWGTGIEQQSIGFVQYTLKPHLTRIEQEVNRKLFRSDEYFAEFNVSGLMRGDIKGRNEAYKIALGGNQQVGYMTVNEVRALENLPPIDGGDELYKPATGGRPSAQQADESDQG